MKYAGLWVAPFLALVILLLAPGVPRAEVLHCGPPSDWLRLDSLTRIAIRSNKTADNEAGREISDALRAMNWTHFNAWRAHVNDPVVSRNINAAIDGWRIFASIGQMSTPDILLKNIDEVYDRTRKVCFDPESVMPGTDAGNAPSPAGFGMSATGGTFEDYARLTILPAIIAAMGILAKLVYWGLQWMRTRRYRRRSCDVVCMLNIGEHVIVGQLTVLGLYGCRFVCANEEGQEVLQSAVESAPTVLRVGQFSIPSNIVALTEDFAAARFHLQLTEEMYWTILEFSTVPPRFVRLPSIKHNVPLREATVPQPNSESTAEETKKSGGSGSRAA